MTGSIEHIDHIRCWHFDADTGNDCKNMSLVAWWTFAKQGEEHNGSHILGYCEKHKDEIPSLRDFAVGVTCKRVSEEDSALYTVMAS